MGKREDDIIIYLRRRVEEAEKFMARMDNEENDWESGKPSPIRWSENAYHYYRDHKHTRILFPISISDEDLAYQMNAEKDASEAVKKLVTPSESAVKAAQKYGIDIMWRYGNADM